MKQQNKYRIWTAFFLAALVLQVTLVQEVHLLLAHHKVIEHCLTLNGEHHIHSEEYAPADCQICLFHIAPAELDIVAFVLYPPVILNEAPAFFEKNKLVKRVEWHFQLRAPPALSA